MTPQGLQPAMQGQWARIARHWELLGPPLRPSSADTACADRAVAGWLESAARPAPRALVLGVTPELANLAALAKAGARVVAVDRAQAMIDVAWRPNAPACGSALRGDWRALPLARGSCDVALGDGCHATLAYPADYRALAAELRDALAPGGLLVLRAFVQPAAREPVAALAADLRAGRAGGFHAFKLRLLMALQESAAEGVLLDEAARAFDALCPDRDALAAHGWPRPLADTIDAYRGSPARYSFPTLEELRGTLAGFRELWCETQQYELAARCPTLALQRI